MVPVIMPATAKKTKMGVFIMVYNFRRVQGSVPAAVMCGNGNYNNVEGRIACTTSGHYVHKH